MTVRYLIPAGTRVSITTEDGERERVTKTDLWAAAPIIDNGELPSLFCERLPTIR